MSFSFTVFQPESNYKLQFLKPVVRIIFILLIALLINALILTIVGKDPIFAYEKILSGALGSSYSIARTLRW